MLALYTHGVGAFGLTRAFIPFDLSLNSNVCRVLLRWPDMCFANKRVSTISAPSCVMVGGAWVPSHAPFQVVTANEEESTASFRRRVEELALEATEIVTLLSLTLWLHYIPLEPALAASGL